MSDATKRTFSVPDLYPVALFEGEGMGTAYEYSAKLKLLQRVVAATRSPQSVFVGGLPEAYGVDVGLAFLAALHDCHVVVAEDRLLARDAFEAALRSPAVTRWVDPSRFTIRPLETLACPTQAGDPVYDLWVSTSSIQRIKGGGLDEYLAHVRDHARNAVLFVPNKDNRAHLTLTKMEGFRLAELADLCARAGLTVRGAGYVDLPPFPPGIKRSETAKAKAEESPVERLAMRVLEGWAWGERILPRVLKRPWAHLAYVWVQPSAGSMPALR
jgi:hypothetical protein